MPPSEKVLSDGWISSEQWPPIRRQELARSEADAFLEWLFLAIARRPRPLSLREGAGVARYLEGLAWETEPGPARQLLERLAEVIWGRLVQFAPFEARSKPAVIEFLEKHASTYLAGLDVEAALARIRGSRPPAQHTRGSPVPRLMSRCRSVHGTGNPHLADDLSERIYAAYHALRRAGLHNARGRIATALNRRGLHTRARAATRREWGSYEVYERVRQYEARIKREIRAHQGRALLTHWRDAVVDSWLFDFNTRPSHQRA